jgi:transcriptional regulator with XRE-family HTH domain
VDSDETEQGPVIDLRGSVPPKSTGETLGRALRLLRLRTGLTRHTLAGAAGVAAGAIANFENDVSTPSAPDLRRLTRAFAAELGNDTDDLWVHVGALLDQHVTKAEA